MSIELLRLEKVSYQGYRRASLKEVSFSLNRGENVVIFGPEESGVEIVCSVIAGLVEKFDGDIFYKGRSIKTYDYFERLNYRKDLGYLQINYGLINNMSAEQNIMLPLEYHSKLKSDEIQKIVDNYITDLELDTCRSSRPYALSASEKLRTAFARSVILEPELLLIEYPLEGQCHYNSRIFLENLKRTSLKGERSVVITTNEPERYIELSNRFIMIWDGSMVFSGSKDDFLGQENSYLRRYMNSSCDEPMGNTICRGDPK